ncbi:18103_t:CDS:2, partial [Gigaspora rosea]
RSSITMLDFNTNASYIIETSKKIAQLYLVKPDVWLFRDFFDQQFLIYTQSDDNFENLIPNVVERFDVKGLLKSTPAEITYLSQEGVAQANVLSARFLQTNNVSIAASIISNLPEALISNISDVEVLSYMRDANDDGNYENFYKNLKNVSIYLTKSGQLATVIPSK